MNGCLDVLYKGNKRQDTRYAIERLFFMAFQKTRQFLSRRISIMREKSKDSDADSIVFYRTSTLF
ncbi:Uncharacterized protein APZ42_015581 [Daphnia magna]|uniref:Uncharacterized protein n=1 Tax=Daphnia magna TaxID=35525 RepID=A0A162NV16_9CRUS|nr:Uncharacterized protein APZ42_015581 [Daphnia magna]